MGVAAQGGPDASGVSWFSTTPDFVPLGGVGTDLGLSGNGEADLALPWAFPWYGSSATVATVGANGGIRFGAGLSIAAGNACLPSTASNAPDIAVHWDDLDPAAGGAVWWWHDALLDRVIVSWEDVPHSAGTDGGSFQAHLLANGEVELHFADVDLGAAAYSAGASATVGIQDTAGGTATAGNALQIGCNGATILTDGSAFVFSTCVDADGDGERDAACGGLDCDDSDPLVLPGVIESCNGLDDDCDPLTDESVDGDGDGATVCAGDCDDVDAAIGPGLSEACDGLDTDCSGAPSFPGETTDADGDGSPLCADCDDGSPLVGPGQAEVCDGVDTDCDGLTDEADPSVNPYTCGAVCGTETREELYDAATIRRDRYNPCYLDPRAERLCDPEGHDEPTSGLRVHRVLLREDVEHHRDELFLFLPPGPGHMNIMTLEWAALSGFRVISLGYVNDVDIDKTCAEQEDGCFSDFREETIYGRDVSPYLQIGPVDSLMTRLEVLLAELASQEPEHWSRYLDEDGDVVWPKVVVAGWSVGSGNAAMVAKNHPVKGAFLLSGPKDRIYDPHPIPSSWIRGPQLTDGCRFAGVFHRDEHFTSNPEGDVLRLSWESLGLPFDIYTDDGGDLEDFDHPVLEQTLYVEEDCRAHSGPGSDDCLDERFFPVYRTMMCAVANEGSCAMSGATPND